MQRLPLLMPPQHLLLILHRHRPHISPLRLPIPFLTLHRRPNPHTSPLLHLMLRRPLLPISPRLLPILRLVRHCRRSPRVSPRRLRLHRRRRGISQLQGRAHMPRLEVRTLPLQERARMPRLELRTLPRLGSHLVQNHILQVQRRGHSSPFLTRDLMWGGSPDRYRPQRPVRVPREPLSSAMLARIRDLVLGTVAVRPSREV